MLFIRGVRGVSLFKAYYRNDEANEKAFDAEGWFDTGDIVRSDENGWLYFSDRDKDLYDSILDDGFSSKHKYYYCGDQVTAEPEHMDEGLARFRYSFPDGSEFHLNMFPLRKGYTRRLMGEIGFQRVQTYGDFKETFEENEPDFFVHVAEKEFVDV